VNVLRYYKDNPGVCQVLVSRVYQYSQDGRLLSLALAGTHPHYCEHESGLYLLPVVIKERALL
jgi:hypothetical protein